MKLAALTTRPGGGGYSLDKNIWDYHLAVYYLNTNIKDAYNQNNVFTIKWAMWQIQSIGLCDDLD